MSAKLIQITPAAIQSLVESGKALLFDVIRMIGRGIDLVSRVLPQQDLREHNGPLVMDPFKIELDMAREAWRQALTAEREALKFYLASDPSGLKGSTGN